MVTDPAAVLLLQGIAEVFDERNSGLLVLPNLGDRTSGVQPVYNALVDGFIIYSLPDDDPRLAPVMGRKLPHVVIDEPLLEGVAHVGIEDRAGARAVAEHVIAHGHRSLAILTFPLAEDDRSGLVDGKRLAGATIRIARERLGGIADAAKKTGIDWDTIPIYESPINSIEEGCRGASALLDQANRPSAILAISDQLALGALAAARQRGLTVPRDLSITGFDDIPAAAMADPPLTTARQPLREKGALAARLLLEGWDGVPPTRILPTELIVRASTGPAPINGGSEPMTRLRSTGVSR